MGEGVFVYEEDICGRFSIWTASLAYAPVVK